MINSITVRRAAAAVASLLVAVSVSGCGVDDVELNGKIFDAMGVSPNTKSKGKEPKMVARAPLVLPPSLERLPQPGAQPGSEATDIASLADPDKVAAQNQAELEKQQAEYCKKHYDFAKAHGDNEADSATGPLGPCRGSALTALKKFTNISQEGEGQDGQVED
jgi:hypothetical protein